MKKLTPFQIALGCDPEFFFSRNGKIIGSEKVIPKEGIEYINTKNEQTKVGGYGTKGKIIIDGVQAELNPAPNTCRENLGNEISTCFREIYKAIEKDKSIEIDFAQTIKIDKKELMSLDEKSRTFGCMPSQNQYDIDSKISIKDATKYPYRSAGGHIHLGKNKLHGNALFKPNELVPILDLIVGNTCVMLDRDKGNIERRKVYGRAGEYRTPDHGIEYRTLSNFWLQSYQLMSLVMGLARHAVIITEQSTEKNDYRTALLSKINMQDVVKAINTNNAKLAKKNFEKIKETLLDITPESNDFPIHNGNIQNFEFFVEKGTKHWFKENPLEHWIKLPEGHDTGFETFLETTVQKERLTSLI